MRYSFSYAPETDHKLIEQATHFRRCSKDELGFKKYTPQALDISIDFSKEYISESTKQLLINLAEESGLKDKINALRSGLKINHTEQRPVLHSGLRDNELENIIPEGENLSIKDLIEPEFEKMKNWTQKVHNQQWLGSTEKPIKDIVNIGIGGSDLGPKMVCHALSHFQKSTSPAIHFISNVDGEALFQIFKQINPETTLFIVASKSFTTQETLLNAQTARSWLAEQLPKNSDLSSLSKHFIAITSRPQKAIEFGIDKNHILSMWDWVGGRYSLWSTIGLPIAFSIGYENFIELLNGAGKMDQHFAKTEFEHNLPVLLALVGIWHRNYCHFDTQAILPYDERLSLLPDYLQQADMESNGKSVKINGEPVSVKTAPILWGSVGTNGQHAFHQLLHQGTTTVPVDFIFSKQPSHPFTEHHKVLYAHARAQAEALDQGKSYEQALKELENNTDLSNDQKTLIAKHKVIPGRKPSTFIELKEINPNTLGQLIALYEHKIFVQSILWEINAFDQWGVELGKQIAGDILKAKQLD